jgi:hypothetical protein
LGQVGVNAPVALLIGVGQRGAVDRAAQPQMIELGAAGVEAGFDVTQTLALSELGESQTDKLTPARKLADLVVAAVACDTAMELLRMNPVQELSEHVLSGVHGRKIAPASACEVEIAHTLRPARQPCHHTLKTTSASAMAGHLWVYDTIQ